MDNSYFNTERSDKELNTELLVILKEFGDLDINYMQFESQMSSAENLGQKNQMQLAQVKMMFLKQKSFYLNLRYMRILGLIMQRNPNFEEN